MNKPQPKLLTIWRTELTLAAAVPAFLISLFLRTGSTAWTFTMCGLGLFYLAVYLFYFPALYKKMTFSVSEERIVYATGVFYTRVLTAPVSQIQFTAVSRSPIARFFGLASVIVIFAGGRIMISGLKAEDANRLAELLQPRSL